MHTVCLGSDKQVCFRCLVVHRDPFIKIEKLYIFQKIGPKTSISETLKLNSMNSLNLFVLYPEEENPYFCPTEGFNPDIFINNNAVTNTSSHYIAINPADFQKFGQTFKIKIKNSAYQKNIVILLARTSQEDKIDVLFRLSNLAIL